MSDAVKSLRKQQAHRHPCSSDSGTQTELTPSSIWADESSEQMSSADGKSHHRSRHCPSCSELKQIADAAKRAVAELKEENTMLVAKTENIQQRRGAVQFRG